MVNVLVVYDRAAGQLLSEQHFDHRRDALAARFRVERKHRGRSDIEVVVLAANTRADLLKTHARYFLSLDELAAKMG
ncbi:hypothetical protein RM717_12325 [Streptomyces griseus]|uniref:Uncharacterized protein n=1 Tax=Streptomyces stephensoniae TaxID=3375367 RepID=A0ABU2W1Q2_9ACTN|nr:hypothetical protein [Streptomyces griseus]MDT0491296.1 hypothetical protein [Streptomyces griseus]